MAPTNSPMIMQYSNLAYHSSQFSIQKSKTLQQTLECPLDIGNQDLGQFVPKSTPGQPLVNMGPTSTIRPMIQINDPSSPQRSELTT